MCVFVYVCARVPLILAFRRHKQEDLRIQGQSRPCRKSCLEKKKARSQRKVKIQAETQTCKLRMDQLGMATWKGGVSSQRPILSTYCSIWDLTCLRLPSRSKHLFLEVSFVLVSNSEHEAAEARECARS